MFIVLIRTIILYILVVITMRLMGKRQIGELQPFELVITIMISELAALPMQDTRLPLVHGVIPILTLLILQVIFSELQIKSNKIKNLIDGKPSLLVKNGRINMEELKKQRLGVSELLEELRIQGYLDIEQVAFAIIETDGQMSVIPKPEYANVTPKDLKIKCNELTLPAVLITDGKIHKEILQAINQDKSWLMKKLKDNNISSEKDVLIALINSNGEFFYQLKSGNDNS